METRRTRAYWPTRIMLGFAIVSLPAAFLVIDALEQGVMRPMFASSPWLDFVHGTILAVEVGLWLAGVIWMIRIFRGPSDEPPPWRYRAR